MNGIPRSLALAYFFIAAVAGSAITAALDRTAFAQQDGIKRTILQRVDAPGNPKYEIVMAISELAPGAASGKHRHNGVEVGYLLEGSLVIDRDGGSSATYKAGDPLTNANGAAHNARNPGTTPARALGVFVVEKGKPLAEAVQ
jgi:quercetin dioxygenase-like cupin family protein